MRTIVIINQKGGCGKTTSSINLAAGFAARGCRTLLVDMDPQSHCAAGLGVPEDKLDQTVYDALRTDPRAPLNRERLVWHVSRNLDLIPSHMMLAGIESANGGLMGQPDKELRLRSVIDRVSRISQDADETGQIQRRYDVCLIDCSPSIGLLSYNAIASGREVIIPVETSFFSLKGAAKQVQTVRSIARRVGMRLEPRVLATMHDPKQPLARDLLDELRDQFGTGLIPLVIRYDQTLKEAASFGQPVEQFAPESNGAQDYQSLCEWLIEHTAIDRIEPDDLQEPAQIQPGYQPEHDASVTSPRPEIVVTDQLTTQSTTPSTAPAPTGTAGLIAGAVQSTDQDAPKLTRAQEMVVRARHHSQESDTSVATTPLKRSMMPHRPVTLQVVDDRVVEPKVEVPIDRVKHLLGVRAVTGGALFVQPATIGSAVEIAASFNAWNPKNTPLKLNEELGIFELYCPLQSGTYEYKLVIDGQWIIDPHNTQSTRNGIGSLNNIIRIGT